METTLELNGKKVHGWVWATDINQEYCMVYGMNAEGDTGFYRYDMKEKTIQRFFSNPVQTDTVSEDEFVDAATKYNELIKDYNLRGYILLGVGIIAVILLIALIVVLITSRGRDDDPQQMRKPKGEGKKQGGRQRTEEEQARIEAARARRAQEREERRVRQAREEQPVDADEERYMRGVEDVTRPLPQETYQTAQQAYVEQPAQSTYYEQPEMQQVVDEAKLQQDLARDVQESTAPEVKPASDVIDPFETFEI